MAPAWRSGVMAVVIFGIVGIFSGVEEMSRRAYLGKIFIATGLVQLAIGAWICLWRPDL